MCHTIWTRDPGSRPSPVATMVIAVALGFGLAAGAGRRLAADTGHWTGLGPWVADVFALVVDPVHPKVVYAGTTFGDSVSKSLDGGVTWTRSGRGLPGQAQALAINPFQTSTLYIATFAGVFQSVDGAITWGPAAPGFPRFNALVFDPGNPQTVYAAGAGVAKSVDGGTSWTSASNGLPSGLEVAALAIEPSAPRTLYAGSGNASSGGVFKTTDGGRTWHHAGALAGEPIVALALASVAGGPAVVLAAAPSALFKSVDGGTTWTEADHGLFGRALGLTALAIDPASPTTIYAGTRGGVFKSVDAAVSWAPMSQGLADSDVQALAIGARGSAVVLAGTSAAQPPSGVYRSTDGGATWGASDLGLSTMTAGVAVSPLGVITMFAWSSPRDDIALNFLVTHDGGLSWVPVSGLEGKLGSVHQVLFDPQVAGTVYALVVPPHADTFTPNVLYRSRDGGVSWSALTTPKSINILYIDPRDSAILYGSPGNDVNGFESFYGQGLLRSADAGSTWTEVTNSALAQVVSAAVAIDPTTPSNVYAWGANPTRQESTSLFKSTDRGVTWSPLTGLSLVREVAIDPNSSATLYASANGAVEKSTDGGVTWAVVNTPPILGLGPPVVVIAPTIPSTVYLYCAWRSNDGGVTWVQVPSAGIGSLVAGCGIDPQDPQRLITSTLEAGLQTQTVAAAPVPCLAGPTALCLAGSRFQVTAAWQAAQASGTAQALPLTSDSGAFWFFSDTNLELLVKVIDGCPVNGSYWVFAGGLTNVGVTLTVTDTQTGAVQTYANPAGVPLPPILDTDALDDCP
jgi:photosystem II stability/assembly factor-like uncharacterized protein